MVWCGADSSCFVFFPFCGWWLIAHLVSVRHVPCCCFWMMLCSESAKKCMFMFFFYQWLQDLMAFSNPSSLRGMILLAFAFSPAGHRVARQISGSMAFLGLLCASASSIWTLGLAERSRRSGGIDIVHQAPCSNHTDWYILMFYHYHCHSHYHYLSLIIIIYHYHYHHDYSIRLYVMTMIIITVVYIIYIS